MDARSDREIEELLGAFALDAVDGDEQQVVADHLVSCARCRAEVAEHREVAALLAHGGGDAPPAIWDRIAASIEGSAPAQGTVLPPPPLFAKPGSGRGSQRSWQRRSVVPVAAAAAVVIGLLGFQVVEQGAKLDEQGDQIEALADGDGLTRAFQAALGSPNAQLVDLRSSDGVHEVPVVMDGSEGYVHAAGLPELPEGRTYQLWADMGDTRISLGVLGNRPEVASFPVDRGVLGLAITEEAGPGVVVSEQPPLVYGVMPSTA
jgi:anti-sigma factor RsiW